MSPELNARLQALQPHQRSLLIRTIERLGDQADGLDEDAFHTLIDEALRIEETVRVWELSAAIKDRREFGEIVLKPLLPHCPTGREVIQVANRLEAQGLRVRDNEKFRRLAAKF